jgi:hypothetical protein
MKALIFLFMTAFISFGFKNPSPLHNVFFPNESSKLSEVNAQLVKDVYAKLPFGKTVRFGVMGGFASNRSIEERNQLSLNRANSIVELLINQGADVTQVIVSDRYEKYGWASQDSMTSHEMALQVELTKGSGWIAPEVTSISDYLPLPIQKFEIDPRKDQIIKGKQGTEISIAANTLRCMDGTIPASMSMELTEVYGQNQLVNADLHTASNGRMLESGGTILLEGSCGIKPAVITKGKSIDIKFPTHGEAKDGMETFIGSRDRNGNFNWNQELRTVNGGTTYRERYYINDKQVTKEEYETLKAQFEEREQVEQNQIAAIKNDEVFDAYLLKSGSLGWINCDKFYEAAATTEIVVVVDTAMHPSVRLVFDNINAVMNGSYDPRSGKVVFAGIPVGEKARIVAYSILNQVPYMASQRITVATNGSETLRLLPTTKEGMEQQLASLNR